MKFDTFVRQKKTVHVSQFELRHFFVEKKSSFLGKVSHNFCRNSTFFSSGPVSRANFWSPWRDYFWFYKHLLHILNSALLRLIRRQSKIGGLSNVLATK